MSASDGISKLEETARRVEDRNGLIKTYLDLKAVFQTQEQSAPLDFLGKAVIVRAGRGILLVATFYSKDPPRMSPSPPVRSSPAPACPSKKTRKRGDREKRMEDRAIHC